MVHGRPISDHQIVEALGCVVGGQGFFGDSHCPGLVFLGHHHDFGLANFALYHNQNSVQHDDVHQENHAHPIHELVNETENVDDSDLVAISQALVLGNHYGHVFHLVLDPNHSEHCVQYDLDFEEQTAVVEEANHLCPS